MRCYSIIYVFILLFYSFSLQAKKVNIYNQFDQINYDGKKQVIITPWNNKEGINSLNTSFYKQDFYNLAHHYQPQNNPLYCGIASAAIILNAFNLGTENIIESVNQVKKPLKYGGKFINFNFYSQNDILNKDTNKIKDKNIINFKQVNKQNNYDPGLTLKQLADILTIHKLDISLYYANHSIAKGLKKFRKKLKKTLNKKHQYMIANFNGKILGAKTAGHISPIVAYNQTSDEILILDVAAHKNSWYWVNISKFYQAMHTKDGNQYRGYLIVSKRK